MPEIGSSGLMSGDGKRGVGHRPQATAPILDSTISDIASLRGQLRTGGAHSGKSPPSNMDGGVSVSILTTSERLAQSVLLAAWDTNREMDRNALKLPDVF
jgi:hypothetical protein